MTTFARVERDRLCDLALTLGEDAPTLCGDWTAKDLVVHLMVRERSIVGAPGILVRPLARFTERVSARFARADFALLVDQLRRPVLTLSAVPPLDALLNTAEFFVHHEDLRRAQPDWRPRSMGPDEEQLLWRAARTAGKALVRPAGVPVVIENSRTHAKAVLRLGRDPVVLRGPASEVLLFLHGRAQVTDLEFSGPDDAVRRLRSAQLGI